MVFSEVTHRVKGAFLETCFFPFLPNKTNPDPGKMYIVCCSGATTRKTFFEMAKRLHRLSADAVSTALCRENYPLSGLNILRPRQNGRHLADEKWGILCVFCETSLVRLTRWGLAMHICIGKLCHYWFMVKWPGAWRHQIIIRTIDDLLPIRSGDYV